MGDFSWNLGGNDATAVTPHQEHPQPALSAPVVPVQAQLEQAPIVSPIGASSIVAAQPISRRELRRREAAGAMEQQEQPLLEFFQVVEPRAEAASTSPEPSRQALEQHTPLKRDAIARKGGSAGKGGARGGTGSPRARSSRKASARGKAGSRRTFFSKLFSIGAMLGVGAIMISTSIPANAFYSASDVPAASANSFTSHAQSMKVASTAVEAPATRDSYTVSSLAEQLRLKYGNRIYSYTNDINGTIQWPFPIPVPISSGFGPRISPCGGCSSMHEGVDFTPGRGVAIGSIADGVVSAVIASHAGLGNHVIVDHVINGQKVQSVYAHMLDNSFEVAVGDQVKVAQTLGHVGSTGESTGAHLHLEIHIDGVPVDPFAWLKANAN